MKPPQKNPPDHDERRKIVEQLDTTMIVEAAAGTGKTTAMVSRIVALVNAGKSGLDTLAAVTFTRKAAAELREKLRNELPGAEQCLIGTVHSFCGRLLRERPVEAGVDPDFEELDDERDARLRRQAWETFGNELFAADDPVLDDLNELGLALADLRSAFERFADYPDVEDWPAPCAPAPALEPAVGVLREYAEHMRNNLPPRDATDDLAGLFRRVLRMMRSHDLTRPADVAEIFEQFKPDRKCVQKSWPDGKEQAFREHERWNRFCADVAGPFVTTWRAHRYPTVLRVLQRAQAVYDRHRQAAHGLNFQDLLLRAAKLLRERPEVRQYFRRRFSHVLVDEFQDTDPVQAEVMLLLTADDPREPDWRKCRPAPGSLFVVGDPKQSIYRFRRADIVTYDTVKKIITKTGGVCVTLSANFRSAKPVVDWVNGVFGSGDFFPSKASDVAPAYVALQFAREDMPAAPGVFQLAAAGKKQDEIAAREADWIARHIRASSRPPGDFLVITRQKKRLSVYADALQRLGIAHEVTGGSSLNEVRELGLWHAALRAALEPDNPVAIVAALRSELFGFSDPELYAYRRAGGRFDWRAPALGTIGEAFAVLRRHADWLGTLAPMIALDRIANDLGLLPLAATAPGGNVEAGSFGKAIELLRAGQADWPTAAAMVAQLGRLVESAEDHDGAPATAPTGNAVQVMNLHKVKGLQAPVVFLADPSGASEHDVELHVDRSGARVTGHLALYGAPDGYGNAPLLAHPLDWEKLAARERQFRAAEENRLLYVAVTRARDQLIVSRRQTGAEKNPWERLAPALQDAPPLPDPGAPAVLSTEPVSVNNRDVAAARAAIAERWQKVTAPTYAIRSAKPALEAVVPHADGDGLRWGGVIHLVLQAAMREPAANLEAVAISALRAAELDAARAAEAVATVRAVMMSELWRRARGARRCLTEVPFVVTMSEGLVRGVIDLAFEETDGWVLADYKTDRTAERRWEELAQTYRPQLDAYRAAWEQITREPVKEAGLYFTQASRYVRMAP
jgi:ATP-dependent helicase/nuclease subunit A